MSRTTIGIACGFIGLVLSPCLAQDVPPKRLSADDLSVETHKWDGKSIQTVVQCFYADIDEYRCAVLASSGLPFTGKTTVRIDFKSIEPADMKKAVEDNCDTIGKMSTKGCRFQAVFTYEQNEREEEGDSTVRMLILAKDGFGSFSRSR
jgi:hypothetical protein